MLMAASSDGYLDAAQNTMPVKPIFNRLLGPQTFLGDNARDRLDDHRERHVARPRPQAVPAGKVLDLGNVPRHGELADVGPGQSFESPEDSVPVHEELTELNRFAADEPSQRDRQQ